MPAPCAADADALEDCTASYIPCHALRWLAGCTADNLSAAGVGESILEQAADFHAALIVLGSRGMGAIKR